MRYDELKTHELASMVVCGFMCSSDRSYLVHHPDYVILNLTKNVTETRGHVRGCSSCKQDSIPTQRLHVSGLSRPCTQVYSEQSETLTERPGAVSMNMTYDSGKVQQVRGHGLLRLRSFTERSI